MDYSKLSTKEISTSLGAVCGIDYTYFNA